MDVSLNGSCHGYSKILHGADFHHKLLHVCIQIVWTALSCRIIQVGGELKRSLIGPPAQSRVSYQNKTRLLGFFSSWVLKISKVRDSRASLDNSWKVSLICKKRNCCFENSSSFLPVAGVESIFVQSVLRERPYWLILSQLCIPSLQ